MNAMRCAVRTANVQKDGGILVVWAVLILVETWGPGLEGAGRVGVCPDYGVAYLMF
jgi:hypothetical protein